MDACSSADKATSLSTNTTPHLPIDASLEDDIAGA